MVSNTHLHRQTAPNRQLQTDNSKQTAQNRHLHKNHRNCYLYKIIGTSRSRKSGIPFSRSRRSISAEVVGESTLNRICRCVSVQDCRTCVFHIPSAFLMEKTLPTSTAEQVQHIFIGGVCSTFTASVEENGFKQTLSNWLNITLSIVCGQYCPSFWGKRRSNRHFGRGAMEHSQRRVFNIPRVWWENTP